MKEEILAETRVRMGKTMDDLTRELVSVRTGRASVHLFDNVRVDYYGTLTPLDQLATLHVPEPTLVTVQPWDVSQIQQIEKAIQTADLGLNPSNDGKLIRVPIPPLTQERRQSLAKQVSKIAESHRTAIRQIRRDSNEKLKHLFKEKQISEDDEHRSLDEIQNVTDAFTKDIDALAEQKTKEILEV